MFEARRSRNGPRSRERIGIAAVGLEVHWIGREIYFEIRNGFEIGNAPGFGAVCEIAVGKNNDRNHVLDGDARSFDGGPEAITWRSGSDHGNGRFRIASEKSLQ